MPLHLNRGHKTTLFLALVAAGLGLSLEASAKQTAGVALLGAAGTGRSVGQGDRQTASALTPQEVFRRDSPSVFVVESLDAGGNVTELGSGVVIAPGRLVTNRHVIKNGASFRVEHEGKTWPASLAKVDPDHDLAELSVDSLSAPVVTVRDSSSLAVGEKVYAIGSPEGLELTISEGLISGLRKIAGGTIIQTSAATSPGSSGGGLFDAEGRLVGITTFQTVEGQNLNFALPSDWVVALNGRPAGVTQSLRAPSPQIDAIGWFLAGVGYHRANKHAEAVRAFQKAVRINPGIWQAWYDMGMDYVALGQHAEAVNAFSEATRIKPEYEPAWENLGAECNKLGRPKDALDAEQRAIHLDATDEDAWINLGSAYIDLGRYTDGLRAEQKAVKLNPTDGTAWMNLGVVYGDLGRYKDALHAGEKAVRLSATDGAAWVTLGLAYMHLERYGEAIDAEQHGVQIKPNDPVAWYSLGMALELKGKHSEALKVYQKLKTLDPRLADKFYESVLSR